jgi:hypothetical protein
VVAVLGRCAESMEAAEPPAEPEPLPGALMLPSFLPYFLTYLTCATRRLSRHIAGKRLLSCYCYATAQVLSFFYPWLKYNCTSVLKGWQGNKGKVEAQQVRCAATYKLLYSSNSLTNA